MNLVLDHGTNLVRGIDSAHEIWSLDLNVYCVSQNELHQTPLLRSEKFNGSNDRLIVVLLERIVVRTQKLFEIWRSPQRVHERLTKTILLRIAVILVSVNAHPATLGLDEAKKIKNHLYSNSKKDKPQTIEGLG
jgi:hypothetical protein